MWGKFDDAADTNPKVLRAGPDAAVLWWASILYANRHETDGVIHKELLDALYPSAELRTRRRKRAAQRLVQVELWHDEGDSWRIHDYEKFQGAALRETERERNVDASGSKLYFVRAGSRVKVARSLNPWARVHALRANYPGAALLAHMPDGEAVEREFRERFSDFRIDDQWYEATPDVLEYVEGTTTGSATGSSTTGSGLVATHARDPGPSRPDQNTTPNPQPPGPAERPEPGFSRGHETPFDAAPPGGARADSRPSEPARRVEVPEPPPAAVSEAPRPGIEASESASEASPPPSSSRPSQTTPPRSGTYPRPVDVADARRAVAVNGEAHAARDADDGVRGSCGEVATGSGRCSGPCTCASRGEHVEDPLEPEPTASSRGDLWDHYDDQRRAEYLEEFWRAWGRGHPEPRHLDAQRLARRLQRWCEGLPEPERADRFARVAEAVRADKFHKRDLVQHLLGCDFDSLLTAPRTRSGFAAVPTEEDFVFGELHL